MEKTREIHIVSLDFEGSGVDDLALTGKQLMQITDRYMKFCKDKKLKGTITIRQDFVSEKEYNALKREKQSYFDNVEYERKTVVRTMQTP